MKDASNLAIGAEVLSPRGQMRSSMNDNEVRSEQRTPPASPLVLDVTRPRAAVVEHLHGCTSCASLVAFAFIRGDVAALEAWAGQLVEHLRLHVQHQRSRRIAAQP